MVAAAGMGTQMKLATAGKNLYKGCDDAGEMEDAMTFETYLMFHGECREAFTF